MKYLFIVSLILLTHVSHAKDINSSKIKEKTVYSLSEYIKLEGRESKFIGDEYLKILDEESLLEKKYEYALKSIQTLPLEENINNFSELLKDKELFNNKIFKPFNFSSLSRAIYHQNQAIVSFGFKQDQWSIVFADFLLKMENKKLLIYTLEHAVGCGGPPVIPFEQEPIENNGT